MTEGEAREKMINALEEGRVAFSPAGERFFARGGKIEKEPNFTVVDATAKFWGPWRDGERGNEGGVEISWSTVSAGFGSITLFMKDGKLQAQTECMSKDFCKEVLLKLIESMEVVDE